MEPSRTFHFAGFRIDETERILYRGDVPVPLPPKTLLTLLVLANNPNRLVTKEEIVSKVWPDTFVEEGNLAHYISVLRKTLGGSNGESLIETVPRRGYRFNAQVVSDAELAAAEPSALIPDADKLALPAPSSNFRRPALLALVVLLLGSLWLFRSVLLPGSSTPKRIQSVSEALSSGFAWAKIPNAPHIQSIAVLPFVNLSGDPSQEYLVDAMTEELTASLASIEALHVISRTSVMQYKATRKSVPEIGKELHVDAVVEGSVLRIGDRFRITAQLIETSADRHLWAESYERDSKDLIRIQREVAQAIATRIDVRLSNNAAAPGPREQASDTEDSYLKARYYLDLPTPESLREAVRLFRDVVARDPANANAHSGLAMAHARSATHNWAEHKRAWADAHDEAARALQLDDRVAEAHLAMAMVLRFKRQWSQSISEHEAAIRLRPSYARAFSSYGMLLNLLGRFPEALAAISKAQSLDPVNTAGYLVNSCIVYIQARQPEQALKDCQKSDALAPEAYPWIYTEMGESYEMMGQYDLAIAQHEHAMRLRSSDPDILALAAHTYAAANQRDKAISILKELKYRSRTSFVPAQDFIIIEVGLGYREDALKHMEESLAEDGDLVGEMKISHVFDPLRDEPRFKSILHRAGLDN